MSKGTMIWFIVAVSLILVGGLVFVGVMSMLKWNFIKLSTDSFETNSYQISEAYESISIVTDTADIAFFASDYESTRVVCYDKAKMKHSVDVSDGTISISLADGRKWYDHISLFSFENPTISVYLPKGANVSLAVKCSTGDVELPEGITFGSIDVMGSTGDVNCFSSATDKVKIKLSTGAIRLEGVTAGALDLSVSTGRVSVSNTVCEGDISLGVSTGRSRIVDFKCKNFTSTGNTGDIFLKNVIASEKMHIERSTGDVELEWSDAYEIFIKTDTGDVEGDLLSEKVFIARTDTGEVDLPRTTSGGICEVITDTGDIEFEIVNK